MGPEALKKPLAVETLVARGHPNIRASHKTTLEITKDEHLTLRGDCIIGIRASKGLRDFDEEFKRMAKRSDARIIMVLEVDGLMDVIMGYGDEKLTFEHPTDIVCRKSTYTCGRTLMVKCNKAAIDIDRRIVKRMQDPEATMHVMIVVA